MRAMTTGRQEEEVERELIFIPNSLDQARQEPVNASDREADFSLHL